MLSVCIPVFNDAKNLDNLLESIHDSDLLLHNYEILVSDGNSIDLIDNVISKWSKSLNLALIKNNFKSSKSVNLNRAIDQSSGDIVVILDSHCLVSPNYFNVGQSKLVENYNNFCAVGPSVSIVGESKGLISEVIAKLYLSPFLLGPSKYKKTVFYQDFEGEVDFIFCGFFFSQDVKDINGFNETLQRKQDVEFLTRLKKNTNKKLLNSFKLNITYVLKQDSFFSFLVRVFYQGQLTFDDFSSSRLVHFIPIISVSFFVIIALINFEMAFLFLFIYIFISFLFAYLELKNIFKSIVSIFLFPLAHTSFVLGNVYKLIKYVFKS
jgi:glycosyltransferase involved in cell wall biosynthesis